MNVKGIYLWNRVRVIWKEERPSIWALQLTLAYFTLKILSLFNIQINDITGYKLELQGNMTFIGGNEKHEYSIFSGNMHQYNIYVCMYYGWKNFAVKQCKKKVSTNIVCLHSYIVDLVFYAFQFPIFVFSTKSCLLWRDLTGLIINFFSW